MAKYQIHYKMGTFVLVNNAQRPPLSQLETGPEAAVMHTQIRTQLDRLILGWEKTNKRYLYNSGKDFQGEKCF